MIDRANPAIHFKVEAHEGHAKRDLGHEALRLLLYFFFTTAIFFIITNILLVVTVIVTSIIIVITIISKLCPAQVWSFRRPQAEGVHQERRLGLSHGSSNHR